MKHVVIVSQHFPPDNSGNASRVRDTAVHLSQENWEVTVLAPPPSFPHGQFGRSWKWNESYTRDGVKIKRLWAHQPTVEDPSFASRIAYYLTFPIHALLWLLLNRGEIDVILTSSPPIFTGIAGLPFSLFSTTSVVVDVRDLWIDASIGLGFINEDSIVEKSSRAFERLVLDSADKIAVTTNQLGSELVSQYKINHDKIFHLPNGVDSNRFDVNRDSQDSTIIYTGNVGHAQDLESCIKAVDQMETHKVTLKIVGDGDIRGELEELAEELGVSDSIDFTGLVSRDNIPKMLADASIGVAPLKETETLEYAVPTKVYEYMASSLPVVATGTGEVEKLIDESGGGIVVNNDPECLARKFDEILSNDEIQASLGEAGKKHISQNYDRKAIAKSLSRELGSMFS
ncbi:MULTISPECIES: glycosyltransferase family 4 protein [Haloferax]|nr:MULTISPECIES: glycosyltransferase family 4 protein [Haloferax]RDZ35268.1 glycosyltransferase WbuB [Haloferax sp. Atlit-24N]RLM35679.1 glycosyltransferase WbuB [Haloferax sp. Atlit-109R]RLM43527.1 glycosyltransferase WbuB [Haloferax sp. Atlit-105R]WEL26797.1 Glycosyltransferase [Haloferax lucentense]